MMDAYALGFFHGVLGCLASYVIATVVTGLAWFEWMKHKASVR